MAQTYEIFKGNRRFIIASPGLQAVENYIVFPITPDEYPGFEFFLKLLNKYSDKEGVAIECEKTGDMLLRFAAEFYEIKAAGGLVEDEQGRVLMIHRKGFWDLPKGKVEEGEFLRQAALREVKEETGLSSCKIQSTIKPTYHIYEEEGQQILKTTFWYKMFADSNQQLEAQKSEGIKEVSWMDDAAIKEALNQTYPNIEMILALYISQKQEFDGPDYS